MAFIYTTFCLLLIIYANFFVFLHYKLQLLAKIDIGVVMLFSIGMLLFSTRKFLASFSLCNIKKKDNNQEKVLISMVVFTITAMVSIITTLIAF